MALAPQKRTDTLELLSLPNNLPETSADRSDLAQKAGTRRMSGKTFHLYAQHPQIRSSWETSIEYGKQQPKTSRAEKKQHFTYLQRPGKEPLPQDVSHRQPVRAFLSAGHLALRYANAHIHSSRDPLEQGFVVGFTISICTVAFYFAQDGACWEGLP